MKSTSPLYAYEACALCREVFHVDDELIGNEARTVLLHIHCAGDVAGAYHAHRAEQNRRRAEANAALPDDDPRKRQVIKMDRMGRRIS